MLGAYAVFLTNELTDNFALAVLAATVTVGVGGGPLLFGMVRPLLGRSPALPLLATLGLSLILQQVATDVFGGFIRSVDAPIHVGVPDREPPLPALRPADRLVSAAILAAGICS